MKPGMLRFLVLIFVTPLASRAFAAVESFPGDITATVNTDTYDSEHLVIAGAAAEALFNVTVAMARVETVNDHLRRVDGGTITCFEHFGQTQVEEQVYYTCEAVVSQGGYFRRP